MHCPHVPCLEAGRMHDNSNSSTIQGDPQEELVRGVQHDVPHESQNIHVARVVGDVVQPVQMLFDGLCTHFHHSNEAGACQS